MVRVYIGCTRFEGETPVQVRCLVLLSVETMTGHPTKMVGLARPESGQREDSRALFIAEMMKITL